MAVAWTLRDPVATSSLIGASKVAHVEEAVVAADNIACHKPLGRGTNAGRFRCLRIFGVGACCCGTMAANYFNQNNRKLS
jgi:hypothetical protein